MSFGHFCCTEEVLNISTVSGHRVMEQCDLRLSVFCQSEVLTVLGGWGIKSKEMAFTLLSLLSQGSQAQLNSSEQRAAVLFKLLS